MRKTLSVVGLSESRIDRSGTLTILDSLFVLLEMIVHVCPYKYPANFVKTNQKINATLTVGEVDSVLVIDFDSFRVEFYGLREVALLELFITKALQIQYETKLASLE